MKLAKVLSLEFSICWEGKILHIIISCDHNDGLLESSMTSLYTNNEIDH